MLANPLSDDDWQRLAKVKDLTPGEQTAEPYEDNYLMMKTRTDRDRAVKKSGGYTSLRWPGNREKKVKGRIGWFESGDVSGPIKTVSQMARWSVPGRVPQ
ncbi:hypothetical protein OHD42_28620 [Escherichia coli]|uniref:phage tail tube protein n=1 Tax=Escherichia coli TaxID=562 RepID=UPI0022372468|nr:phage tail tube protein [Escherichia coli]MCW7291013.1 hypothetical protein [Escherichia coli]